MMLSSYPSKDCWQTFVSDLLLNATELTELATETVNDVIAVMPKDLTPEQEKEFLVNSGRVLSLSAIIIKEMVEAKKPSILN